MRVNLSTEPSAPVTESELLQQSNTVSPMTSNACVGTVKSDVYRTYPLTIRRLEICPVQRIITLD